MPGAAAPAVDQPVAVDPLTEPAAEPADKLAGGPGGQQPPGPSEAGPRQKEEQKK